MPKPEIVNCPKCGAPCIVVKGDLMFQLTTKVHCPNCGHTLRR